MSRTFSHRRQNKYESIAKKVDKHNKIAAKRKKRENWIEKQLEEDFSDYEFRHPNDEGFKEEELENLFDNDSKQKI